MVTCVLKAVVATSVVVFEGVDVVRACCVTLCGDSPGGQQYRLYWEPQQYCWFGFDDHLGQ